MDALHRRLCRKLHDLKTKGIPTHLYWIPAHTDIRASEKADVTAKEATGWRRAKRRGGKWREWDSGYTAERHVLGRVRATIKLALEQKTLGL